MIRARLAGLVADVALMWPGNRRPARTPAPGLTAELRLAGLRFVWDVVYGTVKAVAVVVLKIGPRYKRGFLG